MAVITANTGSNNWNTNGAWVGGVQPSATSDVVIPASAVVTIPTATTVLGRSLTVQASGTLAFASTTAVLTLGDATAGAGNVAISISASATITLTGIGTINLNSTSATQQTITSGTKTLPNLTFGGAGSSYLLSDALTSSGTLTVNAGTFNTGNFAMNLAIFNYGNATTRTLTFGSSAISLSGTASTFTGSGITNLTITSNTAIATLTGNTGGSNIIILFGGNWQGLSFVLNGGTGSVGSTLSIGNATFKSLTITGNASKTNDYGVSGACTLTGSITINGNSIANRVLFRSNAPGTSRTLTVAGTNTLSNVDFMDITAAGAGGTWSGTSIGNCLGNSNITFTTNSGTSNGAGGVNRYWVGGTQSWDTTTAWSETDGGSSGASIPLAQDDVYFTSNSMGGNSKTVTVNMYRLGRNIDWTGTTGTGNVITYTNSTLLFFFGSWTLGGTITNNTGAGSGQLTACGRGSHTITSNGQTYYCPWFIQAPGGTYTLQDDLNTNTGQVRTMNLNYGTFDANGYNLSHGLYNIGSSMTSVKLGSGTWTINRITAAASWTLSAAAGVITAGTSTIKFANQATGTQTFAGNGANYYILDSTVAGTTGGLDITGSNAFNTIRFSDTSNARSLRFTAGTTTTVTNWTVNGTAGKLMTVSSITAATHTLTKSSGIVSSDYLSLTNSIATGGAAWYAGANSTSVSGNTGWIFSAAPATNTGNFFQFF